MIDEFQSLNAQSNERSLEIAKILIKAAKETHAVISRSEARCTAARSSMATHDKETMWRALQEYIGYYAGFINSMTSLTGIGLQQVNREFYNRVTAIDIENQPQIIIGFVYAKEALDSVFKETYKQCVKKLLKQSKLFDDNELKRLLI